MSKKTKPEAEEQEQVKTEAPAEETAKADAKPATDWEAKYNDLNDRYLRMAAEYDNFRKRSQREREQEQHAQQSFLHGIPRCPGSLGVGRIHPRPAL